MSLNFREAKEWAKLDPENRDWRDEWKYGNKLRAVLHKERISFTWGRNITDQEKELITLLIEDSSKWARKAERIFDGLAIKEMDSRLLVVLREIKRLRD